MAHGAQFGTLSRTLHWLMAAMILTMLFIGVGMTGSLSAHDRLFAIHRPLGVLVLVLAAVRLTNRLLHPPPPLPDDMPAALRFLAQASHLALYGLMIALPLVGWAMLSAARYPIVLYGPLRLPPILPQDAGLYAVLRAAHAWLAFLLFGIFLAHFAAALTHALVFRDGVFESMAPVRARPAARRED